LHSPRESEKVSRLLEAINGTLLDMLAALTREDYVDRRPRQAQGQARAKQEGRYKGRPEHTERNAAIGRMLTSKQSWGEIQSVTGCSRATIAKIAKRLKLAAYPRDQRYRINDGGVTVRGGVDVRST
jgi:DNA invertase Pin-like site-specific DNA recombinase